MAAQTQSHHIVPVGVYASVATPQRRQAQMIDSGAALEVIEFLQQSAVDGLVLLGAEGNFVHFDVEEREKFVAFALKRSRKPAAVNISHSTLEVSAYLAEHAADCGAAFVLAMPPHFYRYAEDRVEAYYRALRQQVDRRVNLYIHNLPFFTSAVSAESVRRLLEDGEYAGVVDGSGNVHMLEALAGSPGAKLVGNEAAWREGRKWAHGVVSGTAAVAPELIVALERALLEGDEIRLERLMRRLDELLDWLDRFPVPFGLMEAGRLRGLPLRPDASWLGEAPLEAFREWFPNWLPEMVRDAKG